MYMVLEAKKSKSVVLTSGKGLLLHPNIAGAILWDNGARECVCVTKPSCAHSDPGTPQSDSGTETSQWSGNPPTH